MKQFLSNPKQLLLCDALGALLTAATMAIVFAAERIPTGLPVTALYSLAAIAALFFVFSLTGSLASSRPQNQLKLIAIANSLYCAATLVLCAIHLDSLTIWGAIYFPSEILLILGLAGWEWRVASAAA